LRVLGRRFGLTATSVAAMFLLVFSFISVMPVSASGTSTGSSARPSSNLNLFTPQYVILGDLQGSALVQSHRPHSLPLVGGHQFAATWYTAQDFEQGYGVSSLLGSGYNGKGETIAIIDAYGDPEVTQDLATYSAMFGLPAPSLSIIPVGPYDPSAGIGSGWDVETALDVEAAHAMAPYAHINLLIAANASNALFDAVRMVATQHLGDVVSMSWGGPESAVLQSGFVESGSLGNAYADYYFAMGASEGISFFSSTGDSGAFDGTTSVSGAASFPATSPFVTGVGGTTLFLTPTSGSFASLNSSSSYQGETAWSVEPQYTGDQASSGGGVSTLYPQPYYQAAATTSGFRTVPDVSADANPYTGFVEVLEGATTVIGGTSLASPLWAGMTADLDQYMGRSLGSLNPVLYSIYANKTAYASSFHQVTFGFNAGYSAGPGYNLVTGMGSPNLAGLAAAIKGEKQVLGVSVATSQSSIGAMPQFNYGDSFVISATVTNAQGQAVTTGSFTANLESVKGLVKSIPLQFNGSSWVGSYTVAPTDPANIWLVQVSGSSGGVNGNGIEEIVIGGSLLILEPFPYPFGAPQELNEPFSVYVSATLPNGSALSNLNLTAYFNQGGKTVYSTPMFDLGGGIYGAGAELMSGDPQGTYDMVVNATSFGTVYEYLYFGEAVMGVMLSPLDGPVPSAAPGQLVTFLAETYNNLFAGQFDSNVTANVYNLQGTFMSAVRLQLAPETVQFGINNFFGYYEANFTIPSSYSPGFYRLQFISQYYQNSTIGAQDGNFTTGFYVSGPTLQYSISHPAVTFEGQYVDIAATITDGSGAPVTAGTFFATVTPSGYTYEAILTDSLSVTGVPMQYSPSSGQWVAKFQIPSALTPSSGISNFPALLTGPWTMFVSGESMAAQNVVPTGSYVDVLPYTFVGNQQLTPSSVSGAPLVNVNGTGYLLNGAASNSLSVSGITITLGEDYLDSLTATNATVYLVGSHVGTVQATDSKIVLSRNTEVGSLSLSGSTLSVVDSSYQQLSPALPTISVAGLSQPISNTAAYTVSVTGQELVAGTLSVTIDGAPATVSTTVTGTGLSATGTVTARALSDGVHALTVTAYQLDGMSATTTVYFSTNGNLAAAQNTIGNLSTQVSNQNSTLQSQVGTINSLSSKVSDQNNTITSLTYGLYALGIIAIVALAISVFATRRREAPHAPMPAPAAQT
jgi:subtilase family serine protease